MLPYESMKEAPRRGLRSVVLAINQPEEGTSTKPPQRRNHMGYAHNRGEHVRGAPMGLRSRRQGLGSGSSWQGCTDSQLHQGHTYSQNPRTARVLVRAATAVAVSFLAIED